MKAQALLRSTVTVLWLLSLASAGATAAQETTATERPPYKPTVIIDIMAMDGESRAAVIKSLAALSNRSSWETVSVQANQGLYEIINDNYGFSDGKYGLTTQAIADLIKGANGLADINVLKEGEQLSLPPIGVRPYHRGAKSNIAQFLPLKGGKAAFAAGMAPRFSFGASDDLALGSTWIPTDFSVADVNRFLASLPSDVVEKEVGKSIYIGPNEEDITEITLLGADGLATGPPSLAGPTTNSPPDVSTLLAAVPEDKIGKYYILDVFGGANQPGCSHGEMVYEVALDTLRRHGAPDTFANRIVKVELDFFAHKDTAKTYIEKYAASFRQNIEIQLRAILEKLLLKQKPQGADKAQVPLLYLAAINHQLLRDENTLIISSSFWTLFDGFTWLPPEYTTKSPTILLSAVMNDKESTIENSTYKRTEPLRTFYDKRDDYGIILVGAEVDAGKFAGMSSVSGDGVTCLGRGAGWGAPGSCLNKESGTSLATPNVGTLMFLSKAFWAAKGLEVDQSEAKTRLLLASEVVPNYIDKFASAGVPQLDKLLRLKGAYAVTSSGAVVEARVEPGAQISYDRNGTSRTLFFERNKEEPTSFCGLQIVGGQAYVFSEASKKMKWTKLDVNKISMTVTFEGQTRKFESLEDFSFQLKEIVLL